MLFSALISDHREESLTPPSLLHCLEGATFPPREIIFKVGLTRGPLRWILQGWCLSPASSHLTFGIPCDYSMWQWQCICSFCNTTTIAIRNQISSSYFCSCHSCPYNTKICKYTICFSSFPHLQGWQWFKTPSGKCALGPHVPELLPTVPEPVVLRSLPRLPLANPVMRMDSETHSIRVTDAGFHQDPGSETALCPLCVWVDQGCGQRAPSEVLHGPPPHRVD